MNILIYGPQASGKTGVMKTFLKNNPTEFVLDGAGSIQEIIELAIKAEKAGSSCVVTTNLESFPKIITNSFLLHRTKSYSNLIIYQKGEMLEFIGEKVSELYKGINNKQKEKICPENLDYMLNCQETIFNFIKIAGYILGRD